MTSELETVVATRIPLIHVAVIDHVAKELGLTRAGLIRRALADWVAQRLQEGSAETASAEIALVDRVALEKMEEAERSARDLHAKLLKIWEIADEAVGF